MQGSKRIRVGCRAVASYLVFSDVPAGRQYARQLTRVLRKTGFALDVEYRDVRAAAGWYVALAEALNLPLATLDRRLVKAEGPKCRFLTPDSD